MSLNNFAHLPEIQGKRTSRQVKGDEKHASGETKSSTHPLSSSSNEDNFSVVPRHFSRRFRAPVPNFPGIV